MFFQWTKEGEALRHGKASSFCMKMTSEIAQGGVLTAVSLAILFVGSLLTTISLSAAAISAAALFIPLALNKNKLAVGIYIVCSILAVVLLPSKAIALYYVCVFGIYNILKWHLEKRFSVGKAWVFKILAFLCCAGVLYCLAKTFTISVFDIGFAPVIAAAAALVLFVLYDFALSKVIRSFLPGILSKLGYPGWKKE